MKQQVLVSSTTATSSAASSIATNNTTAPVSRTYQYRKIMKPMLERKRRARINRCLDELKELMVIALQSEGENVAKIEKADILEHTVAYLHKLQKQNKLIRSNYDMATASVTGAAQKTEIFRAGYTKCAREVSKCLAVTPGIDNENGNKLMIFLGHRLNDILSGCEVSKPVNEPVFLSTTSTNPSPIHSPSNYSCISSSSSGYGSSSYDDEWCYQQPQQQLSQQPQPLREQLQQQPQLQQQQQQQQQQYINQNCYGSVWRPW